MDFSELFRSPWHDISTQSLITRLIGRVQEAAPSSRYEFAVFDLPSLDSSNTDTKTPSEVLREAALQAGEAVLKVRDDKSIILNAGLRDEGSVIGIIRLWLPASTPDSAVQQIEDYVSQAANLLSLICSRAIAIVRYERVNEAYSTMTRNQHEFIRIVSHDLRSPLTSMKGFVEMLADGMAGELTEQQLHYTDRIAAGIQQIHSLIENIQDAGRFDPETGFYEMLRAPTDIGEVATRIVQNHIVPAEKQALSMSVWIADDVPVLNVDTIMIERGLINLVDNAIKYTPNGGQIDVSVRRVLDEVWISVRDNGNGISEEDQKLLFRRHVRLARPDQKRIKGSGLGLFIVRSVAQRHGGDAWVESEVGKGSTFSFSIPLKGANLLAHVAQ